MSGDFRVVSTRGGIMESVHRVSVAVVDHSGALVAQSGNPELVAFWRSAAKPFQGYVLVAEGAAARFGFGARELALACASHSSEPAHLEVADGMLRKIGLPESALACGPHPPLSAAVHEHVLRHGITMTPRWSNCSGKHAGMLATCLHAGWPTAGYERTEHLLQQRILADVLRWTGLTQDQLVLGTDGCTVTCFGLSLKAMALAYARFATTDDAAMRPLREAMQAHPELVAGSGRLETDLGQATNGAVIAKVGADGIYCAALPWAGLGVALKVEDGDMRSSGPALMSVLTQLSARRDLGFAPQGLPATVKRHVSLPIVNTRGVETGVTRAEGSLRF